MADMADISKLRVLVIDDEPFMRQLLERAIWDIGVKEISSASNGKEGLDAIRLKPVDVIFCDLEMPVCDGFQFLEQIRNEQDPAIRNTPVVILTGHSEQERVHGAVNLGIHGYLVKPISKAALEKRIVFAVTQPPIDPGKLKS